MNKIPVGRTIAQTYGFAFGQYFSLMGVVWLPLLLFAVSFFFLFRRFAEFIAFVHAHPGMTGFPPVLGGPPFLGLIQLAMYLLTAILSVGVARLALGLYRGPRFVRLAFGKDELRLLGGMLLVLAFSYAYVFSVSIVGVIVALSAGLAIWGGGAAQNVQHMSGPMIAGLVFVALLVWAVFLYLRIRLGFMLAPITVAEHRVAVARNWALTEGNVLRIFAVEIVAALIPLLILEVIALAVAGLTVFATISHVAHGTPLPPDVVSKLVTEGAVGFGIVAIVLGPLASGFIIGPGAFAYRALVPQDDPDAGAMT